MFGRSGLTFGLQAGTTNKETIDIGLGAEGLGVLAVDTATVQDAGRIGDGTRYILLEPLADGGVDVLGLLNGSNLAGANRPDGFVGNDDVLPVSVASKLGLQLAELLLDDGNGLVRLTLLQGLAAAPDDTNTTISGELGLGSNHIVGLAQDGSSLRVAEDGPGNTAVLELGYADLTGERAIGLVKDVLGGDVDVRGQVLADEKEVQGRRGNDNLCGSFR